MRRRFASPRWVRIGVNNSAAGFTIVEVLIVLAVSAALYVSAIALLINPQNKTQFSQSLDDVNQNLTAIVNNVSNGYYPRNTNIKSCSTAGARVSVDIDTNVDSELGRGTLQNCIFVGRLVEFVEDEDFFNVYTVVGARLDAAGKEVTQLKDAKPAVLGDPEVIPLKSGTQLKYMKGIAAGAADARILGFFSTFGSYEAGQLKSGALGTNFAVVPGVGSVSPTTAIDLLKDDYEALINPVKGVELCFKSGRNSQYGRIAIGSDGSSNTTTITINNEACTI